MSDSKENRDTGKLQSMGTRIIKGHVFRDHVVIGGILSLALSLVLDPRACLVFWIASILVDTDHYLNLVYWSRFKCLNVRKTLKFYSYLYANQWHRPLIALELFHTAEFILALAVAAWWTGSAVMVPILLGVLFHVGVDFIYLYNIRSLRFRRNSIIEFLIVKKKLERNGVFPTQVQQEGARKLAEGTL